MAKNEELIEACKELAKEALVWKQLKEEGKSDEECAEGSQKGAWENYLKVGGSTTMINHQLEKEEDFGAQYERLSGMCLCGHQMVENKEGKLFCSDLGCYNSVLHSIGVSV
ncbi:MAG: hypothetical protein KGH57_01105 [Candidatus Micrarchaeota archaeon]|nr:hypothetical protein [Candidatus Micrarchaeota archaeon]